MLYTQGRGHPVTYKYSLTPLGLYEAFFDQSQKSRKMKSRLSTARRNYRARYVRPSSGKRVYKRKRTYRRTPRRKPMSRRRILRITSKKKRDTMAPWSGEQTLAVVGAQGPRQFVASDGPVAVLWSPTKRTRSTDSANGLPFGADAATRTASSVFYTGLRETINLSTSGSSCWKWRRICFTMKSDAFVRFPGDGTGYQTRLSTLTSNGYQRSLNAFNSTDANQNAMLRRIYAYIFQGTEGVDWDFADLAKTDSERVTIKYDKTRIIRSGNDAGVIRTFKLWHGMYKNFYYDEDERGGIEQSGDMHTLGKAGMGDYYVLDLVVCNDSNAETLTFNPDTTLYWHER